VVLFLLYLVAKIQSNSACVFGVAVSQCVARFDTPKADAFTIAPALVQPTSIGSPVTLQQR